MKFCSRKASSGCSDRRHGTIGLNCDTVRPPEKPQRIPFPGRSPPRQWHQFVPAKRVTRQAAEGQFAEDRIVWFRSHPDRFLLHFCLSPACPACIQFSILRHHTQPSVVLTCAPSNGLTYCNCQGVFAAKPTTCGPLAVRPESRSTVPAFSILCGIPLATFRLSRWVLVLR